MGALETQPHSHRKTIVKDEYEKHMWDTTFFFLFLSGTEDGDWKARYSLSQSPLHLGPGYVAHSGPNNLQGALLGEGLGDRMQSSERSLTPYLTWLWGRDATLGGNISVTLRMVGLKDGDSLSPHWLQWAIHPLHNPFLIMQTVIHPSYLSPLKFRYVVTLSSQSSLPINQNMHVGPDPQNVQF